MKPGGDSNFNMPIDRSSGVPAAAIPHWSLILQDSSLESGDLSQPLDNQTKPN